MKNIFLGVVGLFITIHMLFVGLNLYTIQTQKNALEDKVTRAVKHALEENYRVGDEENVRLKLAEEIGASEVVVEVIDLEKGLLRVLVTEEISLLTGEVKQIVFEKTAIMERMDTNAQKVSVTFYVDGELYKEYQLTKGEECPMPKEPGASFAGWVEYGAETTEVVESIGAVWEDKVFLAITE